MHDSSVADRDWRRFVLRWMILSLALHWIAAWFSLGHHSVDEYFQILEFLSYKRGVTPDFDLATEFREQMRPWMQPFLYGVMVKAWEAIGVLNPFTWAWSFRLVTGLLGWAASYGLALRAAEWFPRSPRAQRFCVIALASMWFLPALHVRPSSEALSGSAFLAALVLLTGSRPRWILGGALLGLSFEARFQSGFMIVGLLAWLAVVARVPARGWLKAFAGAAIVFGIGRWIDRWGYGQWVLSPWNYVEYNLLRGEVNRYGRSPPWDVFRMAFTESWPLLGFGLAIASVVAWVRHPKHVLTWSFVPFFLAHIAIAHKELRFFFPIAMAGPVLLTLALTRSRDGAFADPDRFGQPGVLNGILRWGWRFLLVNNAIALVALCLVPFSRAVQFYAQVWDFIPPGTTRFELLYRDTDPYHLLGNPVYFYHPPALVSREFKSYDELLARLRQGERLWVFDPGFELPVDAVALKAHCHAAIRTLPPWVTAINFNGWLERAHPWTLFECRLTPAAAVADSAPKEPSA